MKMRKIAFPAILVLVLAVSVNVGRTGLPQLHVVAAGMPLNQGELGYVPGEMILKFRPEIATAVQDLIIESMGLAKIHTVEGILAHEVRIPDGFSVEEAVAVWAGHPYVEYAEPNYYRSALVTPNDPLFGRQYALSNPGGTLVIPGSPTGKASADIKATAAWEETQGDEEVVIAIVDSGVDLLHPDLKNKLVSAGRDFINSDFDAMDDFWHGTHVAGIAAAETNNSEGIAGVAWMCKMLPVKVLDQLGIGTDVTVADGIRWAVDNGADVINLSLGGPSPSSLLRDAVQYAFEHDVVVVAAAGNDGAAVLYPAAYDNYCLAAAATDYKDERPTWSNYGFEVDLAAPGVLIYSAVPRGYFGPGAEIYGYASGTSMSTPHVSGAAALLRSHKPFLQVDEIMNILRFSCDDVNSSHYLGKDEYLGYGRLNMEKALVPLVIKDGKADEEANPPDIRD